MHKARFDCTIERRPVCTATRDGEKKYLPAADGNGPERLANADVDGEEGLDGQVARIRTGTGEGGARQEDKGCKDDGQEGWDLHFLFLDC